jgi:catechol 2,3-dioxygenase-like lactoylglutathione lyase family enzyme
MLDHISLGVRDVDSAKKFYGGALKPLGYAVIMEFPDAVGLGVEGKPDLWLVKREPGAITHVAFACRDRATVDAFYEAALAAGGKDNGKPGVRADYHPNYYGAFVFDADGHNVEAVCHRPV